MSPEQELVQALEDRGIDFSREEESQPYFDRIEALFPICGSQIDWSRVPGSRVESAATDWHRYFAAAESFVLELTRASALRADQDVIVVGDSAMQGALRMQGGELVACLRDILEMPQHTYVVPLDFAWCMVFTMEGELCFGSPPALEAGAIATKERRM